MLLPCKCRLVVVKVECDVVVVLYESNALLLLAAVTKSTWRHHLVSLSHYMNCALQSAV